MKKLLISAALVFAAVLPLSAFNIDPNSFDITLKQGEKKQLMVRIKNVFDFPVVSSAAVTGPALKGLVIQITPQKLKLDAGTFTYLDLNIRIPADASGPINDEVTFYISGLNKNAKFSKRVVLPLHFKIKPAVLIDKK